MQGLKGVFCQKYRTVQNSAVPPPARRMVDVWRRREDLGGTGYCKAAHPVLVCGRLATLKWCFTHPLFKFARYDLHARHTTSNHMSPNSGVCGSG